MDTERRYVRLMALQVDDAQLYLRYREGMTPILRRFGGSFGYDLVIERVLNARGE